MVINPKIIVPVVLGASICAATAVLFYFMFNKENEKAQSSKRKKSSLPETIELKIPAQLAPAIIGRGGISIKELEATSGATIEFRDDRKEKDADRLCIIQGTAESVAIAEGLIKAIVTKHASLEENIITVPNWAVGKIIGRGGENIREICHVSGAKVNVDSQSTDTSRAAHKKITIKGTPDQIKVAVDIINKCVEKEKSRRESDVSRREPRGRHGAPPGSMNANPQPTTDAGTTGKKRDALETPSAGNDGALLEVFVSAVSSPSRFWLQIIGPQVEQLDKLVDMMTDFYSDADNREANKLDDIQVGQIVAAVFRHDGKWYRAKVAEIKQNEFDGRQQVCDVYFVDYGDNEYVAKSELLALRTDMLQLRFQAVECFLAGVAPVPDEEQGTDQHHWNPRAIERFEELTQVCRWKRLWSRTCAFRDRQLREITGSEADKATRDTREGSPIPGVKLYDTKDGKDINVSQVLVEEGWAVEVEEPTLEPKKNVSVTPVTPTAPIVPPSFGDLECSRVLGMVIGGREERAASLPHGGSSPRASPQPSSPESEDTIFSNLSGDSKSKSTSLAAGMDHGKMQTPDLTKSETNNAPHMNGSARATNGALKQNGDFLNAERIKSVPFVPEELCSLPKDSGPRGYEAAAKHHPIHITDPKDDLKAKINRVDSHHGNLESLGKHNPPPSDVSPMKPHRDLPVSEL